MRLLFYTYFAVIWAAMAVAQDQQRQITVSGLGKIATVPDMAQINVAVEITARKAGEALRENSKRVFALMDVLDQAGIAKRDIRTSQLNLHPRWDQRNSSGEAPRIVGYTAQNSLQIKIRKIDQLGTVLDQVTNSGANRINQISFLLSDPAPLLKEARLRAVADARQKAELFAGAAGVTLGEVLEVTESSKGFRPSGHAAARMESAMAVPIAEGEVAQTAQVQITYALE